VVFDGEVNILGALYNSIELHKLRKLIVLIDKRNKKRMFTYKITKIRHNKKWKI